MDQPTGATTPTDGQASNEPAESKPATTETSVPSGEAAQPNAETGGDKKPPEQTDGDTSAEGDKPAKLTRNQRLQRKAARLATMVAEQQAEIEALRAKSSDTSDQPKEADFNGDYVAYQTELAAWKAARKVGEKFDEQRASDAEKRIAEARQTAAHEFLERAEELKPSIADFNETFEVFAKAGGKFAEHVIEELHDSERGPELAYHLAKSPHITASLNQMSPRDAAREIGRIEATLPSLPQPKKQTKAPPPLAPPAGGAAAPKDISAAAKSDDISAFVKMREAEEAAKRKR
jgi:hypothetical protein